MSNPGRSTSEEQRTGLKLACQNVVNRCGGGKNAAQVTDVDETVVSLYCALHERKRFMRLDVAADLDLAAGEPIVGRALVNLHPGWKVVREDVARSGPALGLADFGRLQVETFEALAALFEGMADLHLSDAEKRRILKEFADLRHVLDLVEAKVINA
jgi:hypothetical protein